MNERQWQLTIASQGQTEALAEKLAAMAWPGMVIALDGDLGAGKTTFSKKFAAAIGVKDIVSSPTFTIIKEYNGESFPFYHMDVYRLSLAEADELGLDDYFFGEGVTIVEWASLIEEILPAERLALFIEYIDEQERVITISAMGDQYVALLQNLQNWSSKHE